MSVAAPKKRAGRRPGESGTRDAIRAAARTQFGAHGYEASLRAIAREAGVDPALVLHFYRSKDDLFTDAVRFPFERDDAIARIATGPRSAIGMRMVRFFLSVWDDPERRDPIIGLLRAATTNAHAARLLRETVGDNLLAPVGASLDQPDAPLRMSLCGAQLVGLGIARYVVGLEPLASLPADRVADVVAPTLQRYLTGKLDA